VIPRFEVLTEIGSGGMGTVYLARHLGPHGFEKLVALKVLHPGFFETEAIRAMFIDEARLAAQFAHPCIAQVYTFGEADGTLYFVMEHVTGLTFYELVRRVGARLSPMICACLAARVCRGLHAAHELKNRHGQPLDVVHRDVTPQNLVLTFDGEVKVLDFGIALMQERTAPATHQQFVRGKPTYVAPEQREKEIVDRRADIYSLSIVLYEMLTRRKLFTFAMTVSSKWKELAANIPPPSSLVPLPDGLDEVVLKGLALRPEDRFQTAREMALALEEVIEREGSETIESFAERELATFREARMKQTQSVASEGDVEATTQLMRSQTAVDEVTPEAEVPTAESSAPPHEPMEIIEVIEEEAMVNGADYSRSVAPVEPKTTLLMRVALAIGLALLAGSGLLLMYTSQPLFAQVTTTR
jgi:serine/threonine-protein kinase